MADFDWKTRAYHQKHCVNEISLHRSQRRKLRQNHLESFWWLKGGWVEISCETYYMNEIKFLHIIWARFCVVWVTKSRQKLRQNFGMIAIYFCQEKEILRGDEVEGFLEWSPHAWPLPYVSEKYFSEKKRAFMSSWRFSIWDLDLLHWIKFWTSWIWTHSQWENLLLVCKTTRKASKVFFEFRRNSTKMEKWTTLYVFQIIWTEFREVTPIQNCVCFLIINFFS